MKRTIITTVAVLTLLTASFVHKEKEKPRNILEEIEHSGDFAPMFPFHPSYSFPDNITNVRTWPGVDSTKAGADGFITAQGSHFVDSQGRLRRFIGTNIGMMGAFPEHDVADRMAADLSRYGINIVRLHYVSHRTPEGHKYPEKDSFIEPVQLERFDYLFAKLKERGIYTYFQLNIARKFSEANGFVNARSLPYYNNGIDNLDSRMIRLQKKFHREILTHINPYTGIAYKDDPAIAMMELANENSIVNAWFAPKYKFSALVQPYNGDIKKMWNDWLYWKYGSTMMLKAAWEEGSDYEWPEDRSLEDNSVDWPYMYNWWSVPRKALDFTEFLAEIESDYFAELYHNLKKSLEVRQSVTGTQLGYGFNLPQAGTDYCDMHGYWCHPAFPGGKWDNCHWDLRNEALIGSAGHPASVLTGIARSRILGKPMTVSEYDHPTMNFYSAEGNVMLAATGAFQGWSALMQFAWTLYGDYFSEAGMPSIDMCSAPRMFDMCSAPQKLAHLPACYAMFVRGDVRTGDKDIISAFPSSMERDIGAVARAKRANAHAAMYSDLIRALPLATVSGRQIMEKPELFPTGGITVIREEADVPEHIRAGFESRRMTSSTGELIWDWREKGGEYFMVDSRNTKVFTGFVRGRAFNFDGLTLVPGRTRLDWLTLSLTLAFTDGDDTPGGILRSGSYLLSATGLVHNTDQLIVSTSEPGRISCSQAYGGSVGRFPVLCEGIDARLIFTGASGRVKCYALDPEGTRTREVTVASDEEGNAVLSIAPEYRTIWYEIILYPGDKNSLE